MSVQTLVAFLELSKTTCHKNIRILFYLTAFVSKYTIKYFKKSLHVCVFNPSELVISYDVGKVNSGATICEM